MDLRTYLAEKKAWIDEMLKGYLPEPEGPASRLIIAMNYSLFAGGKRIRPILCMAGAEAVGGRAEDVLPVACALEMIHTYSLIHDDLPAMDNDDMRRGKPTCHKVFGEALAILAGDALLTEAFYLLNRSYLQNKKGAARLGKAVSLIASAVGHRGMLGGQAVDMMMEGQDVDSSLLDFIHNNKTGALISASVSSGALIGGGSKRELKEIVLYGNRLGLAFQISDDILNLEGDTAEMGKRAGSDAQKSKNTYPSVHGIERSKLILTELVDAAVSALKKFSASADPLRQIAGYIIERRK